MKDCVFITAAEVHRREEEWKNSPEMKAASEELYQKVMKPLLEPLINQAWNILLKPNQPNQETV